MAERCQLPITENIDPNNDGIVWENGIPGECYRCLMRALLSSEVKTSYYQPIIDGRAVVIDENEDTYIVHGMRREDDSPKRYGIEEHCLDDQGPFGLLLSRSEVNFNCRRD